MLALLGLLVTSALALPYVVERFDLGALGEGWKVQAGSSSPREGTPGFGVEAGGLVLRQSGGGGKGILLTRKVELRGETWIRVSARTRAEGVVNPGPGATCGMSLQFERGPVLAAQFCGNRAEWVAYTRTYTVPTKARDLEIGIRLDAKGSVWLDDIIVEPVTPDIKTLRRGHFTYHWLGDDSLSEAQLTTNDDLYTDLVTRLGLTANPHITYWKYQNEDRIEEYTGRRIPSVAPDGVLHTLKRSDIEALVEVLTTPWGEPPPAIRSGLATHLAGEWDGRDVRLVSRALVARGDSPSIEVMLDPARWTSLPPETRVPLAGALVDWLVATKGMPAVRSLFGAGDGGTANAALGAALGMSVPDADAAFRAWL